MALLDAGGRLIAPAASHALLQNLG